VTLSLHARLILAAAAVMLCFFGLTGWTLYSIYVQDAETALRDRLQSDVNGLIAAVEIGDDGILRLSYLLPDARFFSATSSVYARIVNNNRGQMWQSASLTNVDIPLAQNLSRNERRFERLIASDGQPVYAFSLGVAWHSNATKEDVFTVSVATSLHDFNQKIARFRRSLWIWLGGVAALLILAQSVILRWSLTPLSRVAHELVAIDRGERNTLGGDYPRELRALTQNLNALIQSRHELIERYRNSLGDLAHSLKTPLAVLRGVGESDQPLGEIRHTLGEQVDQMSRIVDYQLQKAAASGRAVLTAPVAVAAVAEKIIRTLNKVYAEKKIQCALQAAPEITFHGDESDLMELLGNLLDNAYKWANQRVALTVDYADKRSNAVLRLHVADDGPGIPAAMIDKVLERGVRADPGTSGHGIGLAVARDIVRLYNGELKIATSEWNGADVIVTLQNT
jgi:two-component system sensor histidine kinase PhoQ